MIDIKLLRDDINNISATLAKKGYALDKETFIKLDEDRKVFQIDVEQLQSLRKTLSADFGKIKSKGEDTSDLKIQIDKLNEDLKAKDGHLQNVLSSLEKFLLDIPNTPHDNVPFGKDESDNVVVKTCGEIKSANTLDHLEIADDIDTDLAAKLAGSRFAVLKGDIAKLQRALITFMLDTAIKNGYEEYYVPFMANVDSLTGTGQLPKFEEDLFKASENLYLIPTAEVPLTNIYRDIVVNHKDVPIKLTSHTPCFRSEAGSYGRDTKGLIRQHQFEKIELVQIANPESSLEDLNGLLSNAEEILESLELPYQVIELCTGDLGFSACKTFDIEVWMPSQNKYREISSCSNFSDFQARRANIKIKLDQQKQFAHTINGSALAVGRTLIALLENRYNGDNYIELPDCLIPYFGKSKLTLSS
ncbi:serine--tRNA ligase [Gammaproteobacteria bacterium]|nr:serine--tRNA ligase [Gammaproteobacteria bacterium]|tara:strand:- start:5058 stop:6308 length:1251 start_codon:yes stop_codon:yes gene_type:complete